jgi:pantetheine-phosphate adenylyltransferase
VLLPCRDDLSLISSSMVKEVGSYGGDISKMVPAEIIDLVKDKLLKGRT